MALSLRRPPPLDARLDAYPYQLDAVRAVKDRPYAALFHEQGLGKTKIGIDLVLSWLATDEIDTAFVVTKKSLVENWVDELARHSHITPRVLARNRRDNAIALNAPALVYVTNYETISSNAEIVRAFLRTCRVAALLDESHKIKNPDSQVARHFHGLASLFTRRVIMTGTPVANRPYDLWSQVKFLDDGDALGRSYTDFKASFDLPGRSSSTTRNDYAQDLAGVWPKLRPFSVRETKTSAGIELPEKSIVTHHVDLEAEQASIYAMYRDRMAHVLRDEQLYVWDDAAPILKRLTRLVQCASNPALVDGSYTGRPAKYKRLLSLCATAAEENRKAVIWTSFVRNVVWLTRELQAYGAQPVHGEMTIDDRNHSIRRFKTSATCRFLVATPGTAKEGHTLTVANWAVFFDRIFSLDDYLQAQDRIHRISQNEPCIVHKILARGTIDEWIDVLLGAKYRAAQLAQGDISAAIFNANVHEDIGGALRRILQPRTDSSMAGGSR